MRDVARLAAVSKMTVSRMLREPSRVSPETAERIRQAMRKLDYVPNMVAGSLSARTTNMVAAIVPTVSNSIFADTIQGLSDGLGEQGYQLLLGCSAYRAQTERTLLENVIGWRAAGVVLAAVDRQYDTLHRLKAAGTPVVEAWDTDGSAADMMVGFSHHDAAFAMTDYLCDRGYRNIAFVRSARTRDVRALNRSRGYLAAMTRRGRRTDLALELDYPFSPAGGAQVVHWMRKHHPDVDAIFFAIDTIAIGALYECARIGIDVPGELAVAGFGDFDSAAVSVPTLSTVRIPRYEVGYEAARLLLDRLSGRNALPRQVELEFEVVPRESA